MVDFREVLRALNAEIDHGIPCPPELLAEAKRYRACLMYVARRAGYLSARAFQPSGRPILPASPEMRSYARADRLAAILCNAKVPAWKRRAA